MFCWTTTTKTVQAYKRSNALYNAINATFRTILKRIVLQFSKPMDPIYTTLYDKKEYQKISDYGYDVWLASPFRDFSNPKSRSVLRQWYVNAAANNPATYPSPDAVLYDYLLLSMYLRNFHPTVGATWKMFEKLTDWHTGPHVTNETYFIHGMRWACPQPTNPDAFACTCGCSSLIFWWSCFLSVRVRLLN